MIVRSEAHADLVTASVFKTDESPRERSIGGFDSLAFPPVYVASHIYRRSCVPLDPPHKPASQIIWDDRIELVGWDLPGGARVGEPIEVTLVFRVRAPIAHAWELFAHFDSSEHRQNADHDPVSDACATSTWKPGDILVDRFSATLQFAETFTLRVGFFRPSDGDGPWQNLAGPSDIGGVELGSIIATAQ